MADLADKITHSFTQQAGFTAAYMLFFAARCIGEPQLSLDKRLYWAERETVSVWSHIAYLISKGAVEGTYTPDNVPPPDAPKQQPAPTF